MSSVVIPVIVGVVCFIVGAVLSWLLSSAHFRKQIKNNPPITPNQIRELYARMGKKPTETQIRQLMHHINNKK